MRHIIIPLLMSLTLLTGCYEKKVCCPVDGGCPDDTVQQDSDLNNNTADATPDAES